MATEIKEGLYYSDEHEWVRVDGEKAYIGITDFAQHQLGDIVFVELPDLDSEFEAGESIGVIESVKAVSDMHTPVSGMVIAVNEGLEDAPESLNSDPYGEHIAVIKMSNNAELEKLMNSKEYADFCEKEE
ncbi:glycine cleavage system protein GcvH [Syntrophaceticus schinkii]|jgi:glycine cleavage system H protein|uniref:Glycine cleavage system H protein n=1 Tax=Syntrophaceticus schinkii TaxID=499207 RepID=A0A0B7MBK2_9FIRM|nr:glycine cleavage system protein GcvH [Syntrophaceticus schinkii]CEO87445.1 glycine cleavage complex lipoylprotein [Syntrophaceticus schinkii]